MGTSIPASEHSTITSWGLDAKSLSRWGESSDNPNGLVMMFTHGWSPPVSLAVSDILFQGVDGELDAMRNMLEQYPTGWNLIYGRHDYWA